MWFVSMVSIVSSWPLDVLEPNAESDIYISRWICCWAHFILLFARSGLWPAHDAILSEAQYLLGPFASWKLLCECCKVLCCREYGFATLGGGTQIFPLKLFRDSTASFSPTNTSSNLGSLESYAISISFLHLNLDLLSLSPNKYTTVKSPIGEYTATRYYASFFFPRMWNCNKLSFTLWGVF